MNIETNISLVGYYHDRVNDVSQLVNLLNLPLTEEIQTGKQTETLSSLKRRKLDVVAVGPRTRTASYMRYKIPPAKKKRKQGRLSKTEATSASSTLQCRQQRRTKSILRALHDMHVDTEAIYNSTDRAVMTTTTTRWLETHFWHRKRFVMMISWNYCLPVHHNGHGLKFLRTSLCTAAVIHDASYIRPLQLMGVWSDVQRLLASFTDPTVDYMQQSVLHTDNNTDADIQPHSHTVREVGLLLYHQNTFPAGCMGPATLSTRILVAAKATAGGRKEDVLDPRVQVWIWCHPAIFDSLLVEMKAAVASSCSGSTSDAAVADSDNKSLAVGVSCLRGGLLRFCIRGRDSLTTLAKVLIPSPSSSSSSSSSTLADENTDACDNEQFYFRLQSSQSISKVWAEGAVLGINVQDAQRRDVHNDRDMHHIDDRKTAPLHSSSTASSASAPRRGSCRLSWPLGASRSSLWEEYGRHSCSQSFVPDHVVSQRVREERRQLLLPVMLLGANEEQGISMMSRPVGIATADKASISSSPGPASVSVLLVRKDMLNYSSDWLVKKRKKEPSWGFDVILPAKWGSSFWTAFQLAGARAVGTQEWDALHLDQGMASFPRDFPETAAGVAYWNAVETKRAAAAGKLPKSKRQKVLAKHCMAVPRWTALGLRPVSGDGNSSDPLQDQDHESFVVVRDDRYVRSFQLHSLVGARCCPTKSKNAVDVTAAYTAYVELMAKFTLQPTIQLPNRTLLSVLLTVTGRGCARDGSEILAPNEADYRLWDFYHARRAESCVASTRKANKRVGEWRGACHTSTISIVSDQQSEPNPDDDANEASNADLLPPRKVIGFVTSGRYKGSPSGAVAFALCDAALLVEAQKAAARWALAATGSAMGGDTAKAGPTDLTSLLNLVLFRSPCSGWLRPAVIDVVSVL